MIDLDELDLKILHALSQDATLSAGALGRRFCLSQPAAWRRIKRLWTEGAFSHRRLVLDHEALGFGVTVFLGVKLATKGRVSLEDFERAVTAIPKCKPSSTSWASTTTVCALLPVISATSSVFFVGGSWPCPGSAMSKPTFCSAKNVFRVRLADNARH